jgi:hypothetical protein
MILSDAESELLAALLNKPQMNKILRNNILKHISEEM